MSKVIETRTSRFASIATRDDVGVLTSTTIQVLVSIEVGLPLIAFDEKYLNSRIIATNTNTPAPLSENVVLTDADYFLENGIERFVFISSVLNPTTRNVATVHYDRRYNDIIVLPELNYLVSLPTLQGGSYIPVEGYAIVAGKLRSDDVVGRYALTVNSTTNTPVLKGDIPTTTITARINNPRGTPENKSTTAINVSPEVSLRTHTSPLSTYIALGTPSNFLEDPTEKLPLHVLQQYNIDTTAVKYLGRHVCPPTAIVVIPIVI